MKAAFLAFVTPLIFWQWQPEEADVRAMWSAGVSCFSLFGSRGHYEHPYVTKSNSTDTAWSEAEMDKVLAWAPGARLVPRLFVTAPEWWLCENPEERVAFSGRLPARSWVTHGPFQSFASERWAQEVEPHFKEVVRRWMARYGDRLAGIHVTDGPYGEWFSWDAFYQAGSLAPDSEPNPNTASDVSAPMRRRFGRPVPSASDRETFSGGGTWRDPAKEPDRSVIDYLRCHHETIADACNRAGRWVKEASGGKLATIAFFGYAHGERYRVESVHRTPMKVIAGDGIDVFSAPHTYVRRGLGEDGQMRAYLASIALHGKSFIDEGDDMTHLEALKPSPDRRCRVKTPDESLQVLRREFGMAVTHGAGLWYMDLTRGNFRDARLVECIGRLDRWSREALRRDSGRAGEVALVSKPESAFYHGGPNVPSNRTERTLYTEVPRMMFRAGAPFDWYLLDDIEEIVRRGPKVCVFLDCGFMTERELAAARRLRADGRTLVWFEPPAYAGENDLSPARTSELTGFDIHSPEDLPEGARDLGSWRSVFADASKVDPEFFRRIYREAGVHVYTDSDCVLSANASWIMLHTRMDGPHEIRLPRPAARVFEISEERCVAVGTDSFAVSPGRFQTRIFLLDWNGR